MTDPNDLEYRYLNDVAYAYGSKMVDDFLGVMKTNFVKNPHSSDPTYGYSTLASGLAVWPEPVLRQALAAALIRLCLSELAVPIEES